MSDWKGICLRALLIANVAFFSALVEHRLCWRNVPILSAGATLKQASGGMTLTEAVQLAQLNGTLLVDARPRRAFLSSHIPEAVSAPAESGVPQEILDRARRSKTVVIYCDGKGCDAAERVADRLRAAGVFDPHVFPGGIQEWKAAGLSVEGSYVSK
jgi:rhodanese-related sulfurtransferase